MLSREKEQINSGIARGEKEAGRSQTHMSALSERPEASTCCIAPTEVRSERQHQLCVRLGKQVSRLTASPMLRIRRHVVTDIERMNRVGAGSESQLELDCCRARKVVCGKEGQTIDQD